MAPKEALKRFLRYVKTHRKVSKSTLRVYESTLREFLRFPLTEEGLERYLESIEDQAPSTQARKIVIVKSFLEYLYRRRVIHERFWEDLRPPRGKKVPKWLTPKEVGRVLEEAREPYRYIFEFLYKTGLRIGELENLREEDIQQDGDEYILTIKGKGKKERQIRVSKEIISLLYKAGFPSLPHRRLIQKEAQRVSEKIGRRVTPHMLRHSFAIRLLAQGKPITLVQALLGHSKLDTTAVYTQISSDAITLR